jgi:prepilin-type N-terminal cleavage/methylation domain-containing protein
MRRRPVHVRPGFTLIEAAITTVILGVGFVAVLELFGTTTKNLRAADAMTASTMLADHARELTETLPFNDPESGALTFGPEADETTNADIDDLDDFRQSGTSQATFNPPIDSSKQALSGFDNYRQVVRVEPVNTNNLNTVLTAAPYRALRITLSIQYQLQPGQWQTQHSLQYVRFD